VSICVRPLAELRPELILQLEERLRHYYRNPPKSYYVISNAAAACYTPSDQPFHCDLVRQVSSGTTVLELGCGSAHLCPFVEKAGGHYTGMDHSTALLEDNRRKFPHSRFFAIDTKFDEQFDIVASLYTIEHVVDPPHYLERMWQFCRSGGLLAIICPDFVESPGLPPSFYYGDTPRRLREKLLSISAVDAARHVVDLLWHALRWKQRARKSRPPKFWINVRPRILAGADYSVDADAVHLPRLADLTTWLKTRGATIVTTSTTMRDIEPNVLRYNCYVLARVP
jgi:SAM-dependent methyltransferase